MVRQSHRPHRLPTVTPARRSSRWAGWLLAGLLAGAGAVRAEERDTYTVKNAFREVVSHVTDSTVRVLCDGRRAALGAIVDADGYILTKASELKGDVQCQLWDGRRLAARTIGVSEEYDLALLRVEARELPAIAWSDADAPPVGSWLATPGMDKLPVAIGVVSVAPRRIERALPALGVVLDETADGPRIQEVVPDSGAAQAGLQRDDVITHLDSQRVTSRDGFIRSIRDRRPGEKVQLKIVRKGTEQSVEVVLGELAQLTLTLGSRDQFQNTMGGPLSERRAGFPVALQHDTVLQPNQCGGPLVDLEGKAIGINIARASRVSSYAIPASAIQPLLPELKAGKMVAATATN